MRGERPDGASETPAEPPRDDRPPTEARNPATVAIDQVPTLELVRLLNDEDHRVPRAVAAILPELATAVEETATRLSRGGRLHYVGAGTSGRVAAMDAAELPPTFGLPPGAVVAHLAGGPAALAGAVEEVEDDEEAGGRAVADAAAGDVVVGLTASGRTPYVLGALATARAAGAWTVLVTANPVAPPAVADLLLAADTGPEAIAGSTRLKAASAQKLVLNTLSTAVMVRLGRTYSNLMVEVAGANAKLRDRRVGLLAEASGAEARVCARALADADDDLKVALVGMLSGRGTAPAREALAGAGGRVGDALVRLAGPGPDQASCDPADP